MIQADVDLWCIIAVVMWFGFASVWLKPNMVALGAIAIIVLMYIFG